MFRDTNTTIPAFGFHKGMVYRYSHIDAPFLSHITWILPPPPRSDSSSAQESLEKPFPKYLLKSVKKKKKKMSDVHGELGLVN